MALSREEVVAQLSIAMSVDKTMQAADLAETAIDGQARTIAPPPKVQSTAGERAKMMLAQASRARRDQLHLLEPLGQGGMGVVRSAKQPTLGRHVAVKMLRSGSTEEEAMISMLREAWVTGTLEHPNIVPVYYVDADEEGRPLIVLKRIEGVEWSTLMSNSEAVRERFGATELLEWNLGVLDAVINAIRYAHSRGILHRDLKPENVMVGEFGEVYVLDWGIAVSLEDDGHTLLPIADRELPMAGTPLYMAPEMLGDAVSTHTDVYLLGGLLYQIIAHRPPHEGSSLEEVVSSIYKNELSFPPSAPPGLQEICRVAMAFDPEERYESANAMGQALRDYRQHRSSLQLSLQAQANLHTLKKLAKEGSSRERMQALLGEIRFAFQSAIEVWSENTNAHTGLHDAIETVARVELEKGDPRAAASILAELQTPTPELLRDVERALSQLTKEGARLAELGHQHDANLGRRARVVILGLLASVSIAGYLWLQLSGNVSRLIDHQVMLIGSLVIMIAFGGLLYWSRESLAQTLINRYFAAGMMTLFVAQALLSAVANLIGLAPEQTQVLWGLIWFVLSSFMAMALPVKIWPLAVVTGLCFVAAAMWIEFRLYAMSVVGVALIANAAAIWWPDQEDQESRGE